MSRSLRQKVKERWKGITGKKNEKNSKEDFERQMLPMLQTQANSDQTAESYVALTLLGDKAARKNLERIIKRDGLQKPGEPIEATIARLQQEFVTQYKDRETKRPNIPQGPDRISELILNGRSDKPRTDAIGPNATASDRTTAFIESALENLWKPTQQQLQIIELDTTNLERYTYSPLKDPRSIRLLHIQDAEFQLSPVWGKQKVCTMETFPISEVPPYLTLSYVWQSPRLDNESVELYKEQQEWVLCDDGGKPYRITIGKNLYEALKRITQAKLQVRYLWIDALCINQNDQVEQASQVSFMDAIYTGCSKVLVWLGEMNPQDAARIYILHFDVLPELVKYVQQHGAESIQTGDWTEEDLRERFGLPGVSLRGNWEKYAQLFRDYSWFTRAWVLQELALAPDAVVMFGHLSLPFTEMLLFARFLNTSGLAATVFTTEDDSNTDDTIPGAALEVFNLSKQWANAMRKPGGLQIMAKQLEITDDARVSWKIFSRCIATLRDMQSTKPHDRIFAALGFLQLDQRNMGMIVPNYSISIQELFLEVTVMFLRQLPNLEILAQRENTRVETLSNLPSWVPDYSSSKGTQPFEQTRLNASGRIVSAPQFTVLGAELVIQGHAFDTIDAVHKRYTFASDSEAEHNNIAMLNTGFQAVTHLVRKSTLYSSDPLEVLWRTLIANHTDIEGHASIDSSHFRCFMAHAILGVLKDIPALAPEHVNIRPEQIGGIFPSSSSKPTPQMLHSLQEASNRVKVSLYPSADDVSLLDGVAKKAAVFLGAVARFVPQRQLYVTKSGLVGLGPASMQPGDKLVYIDGARLLFVLRQRGQEYELIGETYLHGRMNGELLNDGILGNLVNIVLV